MSIESSTMNTVKMPYVVKSTLQEMQQHAVDTNIMIEMVNRDLLHFTNSSEASEVREVQPEIQVADNLAVRNLIYSGRNPIFVDMLAMKNSQLTINGRTKLIKIATNKVTIKSNVINEISLTDLAKVSADGKMSGAKVASRVIAKNLKIAENLNRIPIQIFLNKTLSNPTTITVQGNVEVENLNVKTVNNIDFIKFVNDVYLADKNQKIEGNLIFLHAAQIEELNVTQIDDVPVKNLMTTSTDQTILSNVTIEKFFAKSVQPAMLNGEKLSDNVAILGQENIVQGKNL